MKYIIQWAGSGYSFPFSALAFEGIKIVLGEKTDKDWIVAVWRCKPKY